MQGAVAGQLPPRPGDACDVADSAVLEARKLRAMAQLRTKGWNDLPGAITKALTDCTIVLRIADLPALTSAAGEGSPVRRLRLYVPMLHLRVPRPPALPLPWRL